MKRVLRRLGPGAGQGYGRAGNSSNSCASSGVTPPRASIKSGRRAIVRWSACARRQRSMRPWSPLRRISGTDQPRKSAGRVNCGSSSRPRRPKLSVSGLDSLPITPGTRRVTASTTEACRHFPAGQDDVADAQLTVDEVLADAVVDPLVPTAQQAESVGRRQLVRQGLIEALSAGPEEIQRAQWVSRLDGGEHRLLGASACPPRRRTGCRRWCDGRRTCARARSWMRSSSRSASWLCRAGWRSRTRRRDEGRS